MYFVMLSEVETSQIYFTEILHCVQDDINI
jgi:hypothetical protein